MASTEIRERQHNFRYHNLPVRQAVQMKNKSAVLMEAGVSYNKQKLHKVGFLRELVAENPNIDDGLRSLLQLCRETVVRPGKTESALVRSRQRDSLLVERVERLMTTWALEVGNAKRFSSIKKATSYCEQCGREESGEHQQAHIAIEAAQEASADDAARCGEDGAKNRAGQDILEFADAAAEVSFPLGKWVVKAFIPTHLFSVNRQGGEVILCYGVHFRTHPVAYATILSINEYISR